MAAYCNVYGLLFVFINLLAISSALRIVEEPWTDKSCYKPHDKGILSTKVFFPDSLDPLDRYTIAWNPNQDGTGTWNINGSACLIYKASSDDNARWKATFVYDYRYMSYTMEVENMKIGDQTPGLYAFVIDRTTDVVVAKSSGTAYFNVQRDCPFPNMYTTPTKETEFDSSIFSTRTSSPTPAPSVEGYLSQEWNKLTSHLEEIKNNINLIPTGTFNAGTISVNIFAFFISIIIGLQLFIPDLYDFIRALCRRIGRQILQQFSEHGTPGENHALNNDALDTRNDLTNTEMKDES